MGEQYKHRKSGMSDLGEIDQEGVLVEQVDDLSELKANSVAKLVLHTLLVCGDGALALLASDLG